MSLCSIKKPLIYPCKSLHESKVFCRFTLYLVINTTIKQQQNDNL